MNTSSKIWKLATSIFAIIGLASVADDFVLWSQFIADAIHLYRTKIFPLYQYFFSMIKINIPIVYYDFITIWFFFVFNSSAETFTRLRHWFFFLSMIHFAVLPILLLYTEDKWGNPSSISMKIRKNKFLFLLLYILAIFLCISTSILSFLIFIISFIVFLISLPIYSIYTIIPGSKFNCLLKKLPSEQSKGDLCYALHHKLDDALNNSCKLEKFIGDVDIRNDVYEIFGYQTETIKGLYLYIWPKYYNYLSMTCFVESLKISSMLFAFLVIVNQIVNKI